MMKNKKVLKEQTVADFGNGSGTFNASDAKPSTTTGSGNSSEQSKKEEKKTELKPDDFPITKKAVEEAGDKADWDKLYITFQKEFVLKKTLKEKGFNPSQEKQIKGEIKQTFSSDISFDDFLKKLETVLEDVDNEDSGNSQEFYDVENNSESEETPVSEQEETTDEWTDCVIQKIQNQEPLYKQERSEPKQSVLYPDVLEPQNTTEEEVVVQQEVPHFDKISARDENGEITTGQDRADDQWIRAKMMLLKKRGIL